MIIILAMRPTSRHGPPVPRGVRRGGSDEIAQASPLSRSTSLGSGAVRILPLGGGGGEQFPLRRGRSHGKIVFLLAESQTHPRQASHELAMLLLAVELRPPLPSELGQDLALPLLLLARLAAWPALAGPARLPPLLAGCINSNLDDPALITYTATLLIACSAVPSISLGLPSHFLACLPMSWLPCRVAGRPSFRPSCLALQRLPGCLAAWLPAMRCRVM